MSQCTCSKTVKRSALKWTETAWSRI